MPIHPARLCLVLLCLVPGLLRAQESEVQLVVRDSLGQRVPYAFAQLGGGVGRVANDSGVVTFRAEIKDSLKFVVRRIGFTPFGGWVRRVADSGQYQVELRALPRQLTQVQVNGRSISPLERAGFYDRMERARRGASVSRFITPEEIELRNPARITQLIENETFVKVRRFHGRWNVMSGRSNCPMAVVVDGRLMKGMAEDILTRDGAVEIQRTMQQPHIMRLPPEARREAAEREFLNTRVSIDELVTTLSVSAIEIYSSVTNAPTELTRSVSGEHCGLVAIWTGARG